MTLILRTMKKNMGWGDANDDYVFASGVTYPHTNHRQLCWSSARVALPEIEGDARAMNFFGQRHCVH
jgi:hypothetical protein